MLQMMTLSSFSTCPTLFVSSSLKRPPPPNPNSTPPLLIRFRTSHREDLRYLKSLNIISTTNFFSPQTVHQILTLVNDLKSKSFSDTDIQKLALHSPKLFSSHEHPSNFDPIFHFLTLHLSASQQQSRDLILRCPAILFADPHHSLRPTLQFLQNLGLRNLNLPTTLNAHLLNTRVDKFVEKISFFKSLGFSEEEARRVCRRMPAVFGYSVENNLRPKVEYLVIEMGRSVEELKVFPQYFGFSSEKRIVPRHLHLKERNVSVALRKMLLWSDQRFYAKWK